MRKLPTLRHEFIAALALVFTGALVVGVTGVILLLPYFESPVRAAIYLGLLVIGDVITFIVFGHYLVQRRVLRPLDRLIGGVEHIAEGEYHADLPEGETAEVARLSGAVRSMADRLMAHRETLAENIRSLEDTNRQLTDARDELVRTAKMASVGRLSAGIAHEVGNPLGAIMGYLGLVKKSAEGRERELLSSAEDEARRIDRIVRGLLDFARPRDANPRPVAVNGVVEQTLELLSTQGGFDRVDLDADLADALPSVSADPYQLQQVLVNLMLNAADALEDTDAPRIEIRTGSRPYHRPRAMPARRRDDPPDVDYSHRRRFHRVGRVPRDEPVPAGEEVVEIVVSDNGPGIPSDLLDQIFEPFVTTKEPGKGTGLGLAVSARLVDAMGGTISAERQDEGGARFTVMLPPAPDGEEGAGVAEDSGAAEATDGSPRRRGERGAPLHPPG